MLKIYHTPPARSVRIVWLAEEMGLPYEAVSVPFGGPAPAGFSDASPLGQLPAIEDGDVKMIESVAIMQYLIAKHGPTPLEVTKTEKDFAPYLQFLEFGEAGLCAIGNAFVATQFRAPEDKKANWTVDYVVDAIRKRVGIVTAHLQNGRQFMAADRFTAADISVTYALMVHQYFKVLTELPPALADYHARMTSRPGYKKAIGA